MPNPKRSPASSTPSLEADAAAELAAIQSKHPEALRRRSSNESLMAYLTRVTPTYLPPLHLAPLIRELEAIKRGEERYIVCSTPPRGGKTQTLLHALSWILRDRPEWELGYLAYNATQARKMSRKGLLIAERAGLRLASDAVTDWRTHEGGGVTVRGVGEGLTGQGLDVTFVDDPHKDRADAESELKRERAWDWFTDVVYTRRNPSTFKAHRPRSIIVNAARWHPDDLMGKLIRDKQWQYINIPALDDHGKSFWPEGWTVADLAKTKETIGEYSWASLYMGQPRPRGGSVFGDPWVWTQIPEVHRTGIGTDLAFSAKTSGDYSVIVVMLVAGPPDNRFFYVVDVVRMQTRAPAFAETLKKYKARYPGSRARWYGYGAELGVADFIRQQTGGWLEIISEQGDKFIRAQPVAATWNANRVLVPEDSEKYPWVTAFLDELLNFTGVNDVHDDQVDATAAAYDVCALPSTYTGTTTGQRRA